MNLPFTPPDPHSPENEPENIRAILLEKYERCSFCNTRLLFNHDLDLQVLEVVETSRCPGCGVSMTPKKFRIH